MRWVVLAALSWLTIALWLEPHRPILLRLKSNGQPVSARGPEAPVTAACYSCHGYAIH